MGDWDNMLAGVLAGASSLSQGINAGLNRLQQTELMRMAEEARKAAFAAKVAETKRQEELVRNKESLSLAANIYPGAQPQPAPRPTPNLTPPLSVRLPAVFGSTSEFSGFKPSSEFTLKPRMDFALNPSMDFALKPLMNFESAAKNAVSHFGGSNLNPVESILPQPPRDLDLENITRLGIDALRRESLTGVPSSEEADALAQKQSEALDVFEKTGNTSALRAVQARIAAHNQAAKDRKASQSAENTTRALMALADWRRQNPNAFDDESKPVVAQIAQYYGVDPKTLPVFDASGRLKALADINAKNAQAAKYRAERELTKAQVKNLRTPSSPTEKPTDYKALVDSLGTELRAVTSRINALRSQQVKAYGNSDLLASLNGQIAALEAQYESIKAQREEYRQKIPTGGLTPNIYVGGGATNETANTDLPTPDEKDVQDTALEYLASGMTEQEAIDSMKSKGLHPEYEIAPIIIRWRQLQKGM